MCSRLTTPMLKKLLHILKKPTSVWTTSLATPLWLANFKKRANQSRWNTEIAWFGRLMRAGCVRKDEQRICHWSADANHPDHLHTPLHMDSGRASFSRSFASGREPIEPILWHNLCVGVSLSIFRIRSAQGCMWNPGFKSVKPGFYNCLSGRKQPPEGIRLTQV